ncbi:MAG: ATP-dependent protease ATPase subunit HslU [Bacteroidota bacterium]|nr:ATP-dependent protease ATPase subunit HslU [Candidatus Kapabacteria bacterium]MDW8220404.1 ATP-dependent protease ATPase subunit HslU [Bacteroidota bacterium]
MIQIPTTLPAHLQKLQALTPREIVAELDKYIIGQAAAKKSVAIALRNRWRRQHVQGAMREEIMPNNIIMIGPTGVGKTEIARRLAKLSGAPFVKVEATKFTEVGYVGRDVESIIRDLVEISANMVRAEKREEVRVAAKKAAEMRILDILIPPQVRRPGSFGFESGEDGEVIENAATREKFLRQLQNGELEDRVIEIDVTDSSPQMHVLGPIGMDTMGIDLSNMLESIMPKRTVRRKVTIAEARQLLEAEEAEKLIDMDAAMREAVARAENMGIVFIDEIDKVASTGSSTGAPDVSRSGVQRDLLPIVEGSTVSTKYGPVRTDHILFIASGAFHVAKPSDLIPELQGRFPIRVELESLTEEDFYKILTIPENALIKQYQALMSSEGIELIFEEAAIREIAATAAYVNQEVVNIGARRLHTILTTLLEDILYNAPDNIEKATITITSEIVQERLTAIAKNQDLSKYIL